MSIKLSIKFVSLSAGYGLTQIYFEDFKRDFKEYMLLDDSFCVIGNLSAKKWTKPQLKKMKKDELEYLYLTYVSEYHYCQTKQDFIDDLENITVRHFYEIEMREKSWHEFNDYCFISRGYSQGDAVKVLILKDKVLENEFPWLFKDNADEYFDNIFWKSLIDIEFILENEYGFTKSVLIPTYCYDVKKDFDVRYIDFNYLDLSQDEQDLILDYLANNDLSELAFN